MKKYTFASILLPLLLIGFLGGCADSKYGRSPVVTAQPMSCTGNAPAEILLYSPDEARLTFEGKNYDLDRIETANGVKYGNGSIAFWKKGIDAMIIRSDGTMTSCTYIPRTGL